MEAHLCEAKELCEAKGPSDEVAISSLAVYARTKGMWGGALAGVAAPAGAPLLGLTCEGKVVESTGSPAAE